MTWLQKGNDGTELLSSVHESYLLLSIFAGIYDNETRILYQMTTRETLDNFCWYSG